MQPPRRSAETRVNLQFHAVRAPFPGAVGDVLVRLGDYVTASTALTSITEGDLLEVSMTIPPERARQVAIGTPVEILNQTGKVLLESSLYFIAPEADPRTQLVDVRATFGEQRRPQAERVRAGSSRVRQEPGAAGAGALGRPPERPALRVRRRGQGGQPGRHSPTRSHSACSASRATSSKRASPSAIASPSPRSKRCATERQ